MWTNLRAWSSTLPFFPHGKISQVPVSDIIAVLEKVFSARGLPEQIKVDNGRPFGEPHLTGLPRLAMWLISQGVEVVWNRPRTPQDNSKVERSQGTLGVWTEYENTKSTQELQTVLDREQYFYNYTFRDRRQANTTRIERHPGMEHSGRHYTPNEFKEENIANYVGKGSWVRLVSNGGQVCMAGEFFTVGSAYRKQLVSIRFDVEQRVWVASDLSGNEIMRSMTQIWTRWIKKIEGRT